MNHRTLRNVVERSSIGVLALLATAGCGAGDVGTDENLPSTDRAPNVGYEAVGTAVDKLSGDWTDASGKVTVRLKTCGATASSLINVATCSVDTDFVLVGGGAEIIGDTDPGALLTASYPSSNLTTWTAKSKAHGYVYPHQLRAYSIGLKLSGVSSTTLRNYIWFEGPRRSSSSMMPSITAELPSGYNLIGGGAEVHWDGTQGLLLTQSYPDTIQWVAAAKAHQYPAYGTIDAYAIGIAQGAIPGFGVLAVTTNSSFDYSSLWGSASVSSPSGWLLASVGGLAQFSGQGRMLTELIPFADFPQNASLGAWVQSKSHKWPDFGSTTAYAISVQKQ